MVGIRFLEFDAKWLGSNDTDLVEGRHQRTEDVGPAFIKQ